jgi:membrane protein DedA with SNARE-associated domain
VSSAVCVCVRPAGLSARADQFLSAGSGALVGLRRLNPTAVVLCSLGAFLIADILWYEAGRIWGNRILYRFCKATHTPSVCVDKMVHVFDSHGLKALLISKFIIGLDSITSPLSGVTQVRRLTFLAFDGAGALLWLIAYMGVGYVFRNRLDHIARYSQTSVLIAAVIVAAVVVALSLRTVIRRARFVDGNKRA